MLSTVFLSFEDREMRMTFEKEKKAYYGRILLVVWPIMILLTVALIALDAMGHFETDMATHVVNIAAVIIFFLLWLSVRKFFFVYKKLPSYSALIK